VAEDGINGGGKSNRMQTINRTAVKEEKIGSRSARPSTALLWQKTFVGLPGPYTEEKERAVSSAK
jgi:hypothetical protein